MISHTNTHTHTHTHTHTYTAHLGASRLAHPFKFSKWYICWLSIRCYKTRFFCETNNTDRNGLNKQNTYTHTPNTQRKITLKRVSLKINDNPLFKNNPPILPTPPFLWERKLKLEITGRQTYYFVLLVFANITLIKCRTISESYFKMQHYWNRKIAPVFIWPILLNFTNIR